MTAVRDSDFVPRECRRLSDAGEWVYKVRFGTRADAVRLLGRDKRRRPYVCPDCSFWHVGHAATGGAA